MNKFQYLRISQQGVVLFIALVALVVMSLAAAALIRSVDTNTVISGNLAFQQSAVLAADNGAEAAFDWLDTISKANNLPILNNNIPGQGYYATIPDLQQAVDPAKIYLDNPTSLRSSATWANSVQVASLNDGNTVDYIVERMCLREDDPNNDPEHCLFGARPENPNLSPDCGYQKCAETADTPSPIFRVTVRVRGPKNTVSYTQAYAY